MIVSILMERNLRVVANYLVLSLAVADLLVAVLVMPLGAVNEVSRENLLLLCTYLYVFDSRSILPTLKYK